MTEDTKGTVKCHLQILSHMRNFVGRIGDHRTTVMCDRGKCSHDPHDPHLEDPATIVLHHQWKANGRTEVLKHQETNLPIKNAENCTVLCASDWNSPSGVDKVRGAFRML